MCGNQVPQNTVVGFCGGVGVEQQQQHNACLSQAKKLIFTYRALKFSYIYACLYALRTCYSYIFMFKIVFGVFEKLSLGWHMRGTVMYS